MIPETEPVKVHYGNNTATQFDFDFFIEDESQLRVTHTDLNGISTVLKYGVDYTIHEIGNENGSYIIFPIQGSKYSTLAWNQSTNEKEMLVNELVLPFSQEAEYEMSKDLNKKNLEKSFDYQMRCLQIVNRKINRAVKVPEGSSNTPDDLINNINQAQITAQSFAKVAEQQATAAQNSAIAAGEQATIATQQAATVQETYTDAMADIEEKHSEAVLDIQNNQGIAEESIAADKADALSSISTAKTNALAECNAEVIKAQIYAQESGGKGMPTDICKKLNIEYDTENCKVKLKWKDPGDTYNSLGQILSTWAGTVIVCKEGSYPENHDDGTVVLNSKVRNQYLNQELIYQAPAPVVDITNLKFRAFPYSANGVYNKNPQNCFDEIVIFEFLYDSKNSNVNGSISYPAGCTNEFYAPARMDYNLNKFNYGSWGDTFIMSLVIPVMLYNQNATDDEGNSLNGQVMEYLNPDNYAYTVDGNASHIKDQTCNANGMAQWKQVWIYVEEYEPDRFHVYIANKKVNNDYKCLMHYDKDGNLKEFYYKSLYFGSNISNIIRSLSGKAICKNLAGNTQLDLAKANGAGWDGSELAFVMTRQLLLMLISKTTDTQAAFGNGRHTGGTAQSNNQLDTGTLDDKGQFYGDNGNGMVKVFHSEAWGNIWDTTNGLIQKNGKLFYKLTPNTNDGSTATSYNATGEGYIDSGITLSGTSGGYISGVGLVGGFGFLPKNVSGSSSTYIPDGTWWNTANVGFARFGGYSDTGLVCGSFALNVHYPVSLSGWTYGVALSYC